MHISHTLSTQKSKFQADKLNETMISRTQTHPSRAGGIEKMCNRSDAFMWHGKAQATDAVKKQKNETNPA